MMPHRCICEICRREMRPGLRIDAGLRFHPALERASNTREGWIAEMEQAHDGEWVHISALAAVIRAQRRSVSQETK